MAGQCKLQWIFESRKNARISGQGAPHTSDSPKGTQGVGVRRLWQGYRSPDSTPWAGVACRTKPLRPAARSTRLSNLQALVVPAHELWLICRGVRNVRNPRPNDGITFAKCTLLNVYSRYRQNLKVRDLTIMMSQSPLQISVASICSDAVPCHIQHQRRTR